MFTVSERFWDNLLSVVWYYGHRSTGFRLQQTYCALLTYYPIHMIYLTSWIASRQPVVELLWNRIPAAGIRIVECYDPGCRYGCVVLFTGWFHRCIRHASLNASLMHRWINRWIKQRSLWEVQQSKIPAAVNIRPLDSATIETDIRQHPNKHVTFQNNFIVEPRHWGRALTCLTAYNTLAIYYRLYYRLPGRYPRVKSLL